MDAQIKKLENEVLILKEEILVLKDELNACEDECWTEIYNTLYKNGYDIKKVMMTAKESTKK
jgi:hypothetical protein